MKVILRGYGNGMTLTQRQNARTQAADTTRTRGTSKVPLPPQGVVCQPGPQGILVTWNYPQFNEDIQRWRVYKNNETTLYAEIKDRGTRQCFVDGTSGVPINVLVSSLNMSGVESPKTVSKGTPAASTAAVPNVPPEYTQINSGGKDKTTDFQ